MEIKTRFNPADDVFVIYWYKTMKEWRVETPHFPIAEVRVCIANTDWLNYKPPIIQIIYCFCSHDRHHIHEIDEKDVFATFDEAQAECDKRNKGE